MPAVVDSSIKSEVHRDRRIGFESPYPVAVSQIGPTEWELICQVTYQGSRQTWVIPEQTTTDFASVPAVLRHLVSETVEIASTVLHDYLWRCVVPRQHAAPPAERVTYHDADGILRQALLTQGVGLLRRWLIWTGVRWAAFFWPGGRRGWWRDAPAVVAITLAALPLVLLPAPLGLALLIIAEWMVSPLDGRRRRLATAGR